MSIQRRGDLENRVPDIIHQGRTMQFIFPIRLLRPHDLLWLELRFKNFKMENKRLVKTADPALMMVTFQPQAIAEEAGTQEENLITLPHLPARMMISNESRLVFRIKKSVLQLTADDLLDWTEHELEVNIRAQEPSKPRPIISGTGSMKFQSILQKLDTLSLSRINNVKSLSPAEKMTLRDKIGMAPTTDLTAQMQQAVTELLLKKMGPPSKWQTSLEVPFRLFLSPTKSGGWINAIKLAEGGGVRTPANKLYELWHTRLGIRTNKGIDESNDRADEKYLRVLWGEKIDEKHGTEISGADDAHIGVTSLTDRDRHNLVHLTSNYGISGYTPLPVTAYKLFLTTLGATLNSLYYADFKQIEKANPLVLRKWRHIQSLAREHYVETMEAGFILPFAHEAVLIKITERKSNKGTFTATNLQRTFLVITQPVKGYEYVSNGVFHNFCFSSVEVLNPVSPLLDTEKTPVVIDSEIDPNLQFLVKSNNADVIFEFNASDLNGNTVNFKMPLVWVSWEILSEPDPKKRDKIFDTFEKNFMAKTTNLNGQKVSLAPEEDNGCDTAFASYNTEFNINVDNVTEPQGFLPILRYTNIIEPSYQRITGKAEAVKVSMEDDRNIGKVFAKVLSSAGVNFGGFADRSGGIAVPNFDFRGLSKAAGAFGGDPDKVKAATATAQDFFNAGSVPDPVLFGVFKLSDILSVANGASAYNLGAKAVNRTIPNLSTEETATEIISTYVLKPTLKPVTIEGVVEFIPNGGSFSILTEARVNKQSGATSFTTEAMLKNVNISLFDKIVSVQFEQVSFTASAGKSADIDVKMKDPALIFGGPLTFINTLQRLIPDDGFSDPPYLDVSATGVKCGYSLGVPNLQLGAFTLSNIGLGAQVNLPFSGGPMTLGFRFCEKQQPFNLTVSLLGGGGYFGLEADLRGIRQIDAALEFGAAVALNLGVASGSVSIMAGIYFKMIIETNETSTQLTGYLRINGSMSILGLISASIELYMAFTYLSGKNKAYGEASISIKVEVLCFSKTVTVRATRTFAGSGSDPNFQLTYTEDKWKEYCEAFAA